MKSKIWKGVSLNIASYIIIRPINKLFLNNKENILNLTSKIRENLILIIEKILSNKIVFFYNKKSPIPKNLFVSRKITRAHTAKFPTPRTVVPPLKITRNSPPKDRILHNTKPTMGFLKHSKRAPCTRKCYSRTRELVLLKQRFSETAPVQRPWKRVEKHKPDRCLVD